MLLLRSGIGFFPQMSRSEKYWSASSPSYFSSHGVQTPATLLVLAVSSFPARTFQGWAELLLFSQFNSWQSRNETACRLLSSLNDGESSPAPGFYEPSNQGRLHLTEGWQAEENLTDEAPLFFSCQCTSFNCSFFFVLRAAFFQLWSPKFKSAHRWRAAASRGRLMKNKDNSRSLRFSFQAWKQRTHTTVR